MRFGHNFLKGGSYWPKTNASELHFAGSFQGYSTRPYLAHSNMQPKYHISRLLVHVIFHIHSLWQDWVVSFVIILASERTWQDLREVSFRKVMLHAESCCRQFGLQRQKVVNILPKSRRSSNLCSKSSRASWEWCWDPFRLRISSRGTHPCQTHVRPL